MSNADQGPERQWAERIRGGDRTAFEDLFRAYYERLCAFVERYVGAPEVAEGIVQEVFLKVWRRRQSLKPQGSAKSYLYTVARRQALDHLKHQRVVEQWAEEAQYQERPAQRTPEEELRRKELSEAVQEVIDRLPERRRLVFVLSRQHGLTYKEIATTLNISVATVETQMRRAFKTLREQLIDHRPTLSVPESM